MCAVTGTVCLSLTGRHLMSPASIGTRVGVFFSVRCKANEHWRRHKALNDAAFMGRHGGWSGPYEESTLFFYSDEYIKDATKDKPKDMSAEVAATAEWLHLSLKKELTLVWKTLPRSAAC